VNEREREPSPASTALDAAARKAARGDRAAFTAIVAATTQRLHRLAARITGDPGEAEDALQDGYLRAFDALVAGRFDGRAGVETWLYRIIANASLDALRARKRRRARLGDGGEEADAASPMHSPEQLAARASLRELDTWLAELPPDQRTAIVLKEIEGLSSNEVAAVMNSSVGAVEQRLVRARAALRKRSGEGE